MTVRVNFYSTFLRQAAGGESVQLAQTPKTVRELLDMLASELGPRFVERVYDPREKALKRDFVLLVNGHSVKLLKGLETPLSSGDQVTFDTVDVVEVVGGG